MNKTLLREKIAQLFIVRASGYASDSEREYPSWELSNTELKRLLGQGVGGVILLGGSSVDLQYRCRVLKEWAKSPLLLCADIEEGLGQRFSGGTWLVPPMAFADIYCEEPEKAIELAEKYGLCIGSQAKRCGLNWVLAPVCDVNSNLDNPVINMRSWGEDPLAVSYLTSAFSKGLASAGVLSCAKHFPGHGDTKYDSHIQLPTIKHDIDRLSKFELLPFKKIIQEGVDAVMTAHISLPNIDAKNPATFSSFILKNILRSKIGFNGLIVTDALVMDSISNLYRPGEAALKAFIAGADLIMMPKDIDQSIESIYSALRSGQIPISRLDESLHRRENALSKYESESLSLEYNKNGFNCTTNDIETPSERNFSIELINQSLEFSNCIKVNQTKKGINLIRIPSFIDKRILSKNSPAVSLPKKLGYEAIITHSQGVSPWQINHEELLDLIRIGEGPILIQIFMRGNPFLGTLQDQELWLKAVSQVEMKDRLAGVVVYGSKYFWSDIKKIIHPSIPAAYTPAQQQSSQLRLLSSLLDFSGSEGRLLSKEELEFTD